jgi:hypothetical protein
VPEGIASADDPDGADDEITIDPLRPALPIPVSRAIAVIADRIPREWPVRNGRRLTWRGWLLAAAAATVVIGSLQLTGVIWTGPQPRWAHALGTGVTVTGPEQVAPGHDSPGAALTGLLAALSSKDPASSCHYVAPRGPSADCHIQPGIEFASSVIPYPLSVRIAASVKIGYVATDGTRALVGFTGKICSPSFSSRGARVRPVCETNTDPAAIFSAGNTFETLLKQTANAFSGDIPVYSLFECVNVGGKWYAVPGQLP